MRKEKGKGKTGEMLGAEVRHEQKQEQEQKQELQHHQKKNIRSISKNRSRGKNKKPQEPPIKMFEKVCKHLTGDVIV